MKRMLQTILCVAAVAAALAFSCSPNRLANGGVSETTNGVVACIVYPDGKPCANCIVRLRPNDYLASIPGRSSARSPLAIDSLTDSKGMFHISGVSQGSYIVEVADTTGYAIALTAVITNPDSLANLGTDTAHPVGAVSGAVAILPQGSAFLQVRGLERVVAVNSETGNFLCANIPQGSFTVRIVAAESDSLAIELPGVNIISGDTTDVGLVSLWKTAKHIVLNTAQSGAGVTETVVDFPVLVHLTAATFDFSASKRSGADLAFFRKSNLPLPYEIDQWDSTAGNALVWVRVDTVLGNKDSQSVLMVVDASGLLSRSAETVFDTAQGFQGVWHFNEAGDAPCLDATQNGYTGTPYGMNAQSSVPAAIGIGRKFDGSSSWFQMHGTAPGKLNFSENGNFTVSAWVLLDTTDTGSQVVVSKGYRQYYLKAVRDTLTNGYRWNFTDYQANNGWQETRAGASISSWTYVVARRVGSHQYLYINGQPVDSSIAMVPDTLPRDTGNDFTVGRYIQAITGNRSEGFGYFHGLMDEVCVSSVARSAAWIKLCYMNQGATDAFVRVK